MRTLLRRHRLLVMSVLLGSCAFASSYSLLRGYVRSAPVVMVVRDVEAFARLGPGDVKLADLPVRGIPQGAVTDISDAVGRYARTDLVAGQALMAGHLVQVGGEAGLSYDLPSGSRGFFLPVPASRAVGGLLREGERVDVIVVPKQAGSGYGLERFSAFTAFQGLAVREVVVAEDSGEFLGIVVLAQPADCVSLAGFLGDADLYLAAAPQQSGAPTPQAEVWTQR